MRLLNESASPTTDLSLPVSYPRITFAKNQLKMLQLGLIRQQPDFVKERLAVRNFKQPELVDEILELDVTVRKLKAEIEDGSMKLNKMSAEIPELYKKGLPQEAEQRRWRQPF